MMKGMPDRAPSRVLAADKPNLEYNPSGELFKPWPGDGSNATSRTDADDDNCQVPPETFKNGVVTISNAKQEDFPDGPNGMIRATRSDDKPGHRTGKIGR